MAASGAWESVRPLLLPRTRHTDAHTGKGVCHLKQVLSTNEPGSGLCCRVTSSAGHRRASVQSDGSCNWWRWSQGRGSPSISHPPCRLVASAPAVLLPLLPATFSTVRAGSQDPFPILPSVSKADCYVKLWLPTASPSCAQTRVIDNCSDPEWNEAFHYRIHGAVKVRWRAAGGRGRAPSECLPCLRLPACPVSRTS